MGKWKKATRRLAAWIESQDPNLSCPPKHPRKCRGGDLVVTTKKRHRVCSRCWRQWGKTGVGCG